MFYKHVLLGVTLTLISAITSAEGVVRIHLHEWVEVNTQELKLGDVALIECIDMQLKEKLSKAKIGRSPHVGYQGRFSMASIESRVNNLFPYMGSKIQWQGASLVTVKALGASLNKDRYLEGAKQHLVQLLISNYDNVQVQIYGLYKDLVIPEGDLKLNYHVKHLRNLHKRIPVWVDVLVNENKIQSLPVWFKVKAYGQVLSLKHDLTVGSMISEDMFIKKQADIATVRGTVLSRFPKSYAMRTKKRLVSGDVLAQENIEIVPAVVKGGRVKVIATTKNVTISTEATSLQDGNIGDRVRIQQGQETIKYSATVIGINTLSVDGVRK